MEMIKLKIFWKYKNNFLKIQSLKQKGKMINITLKIMPL